MINKELSKAIKSRRSIFPKYFNGQLIEENTIIELLENANSAPSHKMTQPWYFKIFSHSAKEKLLQEIIKKNTAITENKIKKLREKFDKSSHIICICMKIKRDLLPEWEEIAATAMAVQNLWISCVGSNIGGYWSTPKYISKLSSFLKLNEDEKCLGFFYLGVHDLIDSRSIKRKNVKEKIEWYK